ERSGQRRGVRCRAPEKAANGFRRVPGAWRAGAPPPATDFIGVDFGVVKLAVDSAGEAFSGEGVEKTRRRYHARRQALQSAAAKRKRRGHRPKSIRRKLKSTGQKERRVRKKHNHHTHQ